MSVQILTREREYGSGGNVIAEKAAARLGWKLWDQLLTQEIATALHTRGDIGSASLLRRYEGRQKRATLPLFWMTRLIVEIYTRDTAPAKLARQLLLRVSDRLVPFKRSIARSLSGG